jgi:hypothetical protein
LTILHRKLIKAPVFLSLLCFGLMSLESSAQPQNPPAFSYLLHCSGCHIEDGSGDPPEVPDLRQDLDRLLSSAKGRGYMLRVPGVTDSPITTQEMADLMNWMISEFYPELEGFEPYSATEVQAGRDNRLANPVKYRDEYFPQLSD